MIQYPAKLPPPLQEGYGLSTVDPMRSTQMVTGRRRYRKVHDFVPTTVQANFNFSQAEASFFEGWFARTLENGFQWFECPLITPMGFKMYEAHFVGIYEGPSLVQINRWRYSAMLELRERPLLPEGWEQFPDLWIGQDIIDRAINQEWPKA